MKTPVFFFCLAAAASVAAAPINLGDPGFESNDLSGDGSTPVVGPEWEKQGDAVEERLSGFAAEGTDHLGILPGSAVWQDLAVTYQANTRYTLTVAVGHRAGETDSGNASSYALADTDGTILASAALDAFTLPEGSFADAPPLVFETSANPLAVGSTIRVLLRGQGSGRSQFDDIRLEADDLTPVGVAAVETTAATAITGTSATLNGTVTAIGSDAPMVTIFYGPTNGGTDPGAWAQSVAVPGTVSGSFTAPVAGLQPGTTYFFSARASNSSGERWSLPAGSFETGVVLPTVEVGEVTEIAATSATVSIGVPSTGGDPPTVTLFYGPGDGLFEPAAWEQARSLGVVSGTLATIPLAELQPDLDYFFRARARNSAGEIWTAMAGTFRTLPAGGPAVELDETNGITGTSANLRGMVTDTGLDAPVVTLFYGTSDGGMTADWDHAVDLGVQTGAFEQFVGGLSPFTTYFLIARAVNAGGTTWSAPGATFTTTAEISNRVVINEIHYDPEPKTDPVDFIELYNAGSETEDLGGWRLTSAVEFTFPAGTTLEAGAHLVVCRDPAAFSRRFGFPALGPWTGTLSNDGERIRLVDGANLVEDEVDYGVGFPWPTGSLDSGRSIELVNPALDNDLGGHWRVGGDASGSGGALVPMESAWRYFPGTEEPSGVEGAWREVDFDDSAWSAGRGPIGTGEDFVESVLVGMEGNFTTTYFRRRFEVPNPSAIARLTLRARYDDGLNVWINGTRVTSDNVSAENLPHNATAESSVEDSSYRERALPNPQGYLVAGTNVIAVQVLNSALSGDPDFFWDGELVLSTGTSGLSPGLPNGAFSVEVPPAVRQVAHEPKQPATGEPVRISAKVTDIDGVQSVQLAYQVVRPGRYIRLTDAIYESSASWALLPMVDDGTNGDLFAGDDVFTAIVPESVQRHRFLIRYRITVEDAAGNTVRTPYADDPQPNFAYFVYDGNPGWRGRVRPPSGAETEFSPELLDSVPTYHLITQRQDHVNAQYIPNATQGRYTGSDYLWLGTLVYDGEVYDHVRYRARGGVWRYAMGKNMWKFRFNDGHGFEARDDYGRKYPEPWRRLNFSALIQQGNFRHRGEQGLFEGVGFRLFNLAGVEAPRTHYVHFRIVENAREFGASQYDGDFQGLYLAVEQPDGRFLKTHDLPESNIFKMENNTGVQGIGGELKYQGGPQLPSDSSDLIRFKRSYENGSQSEDWWRANLDVERYYSYRTIVDGIHHYDIANGKNYYYFHNGDTGRWQVHPWDLDLTWADNMFGTGNEPFLSRVLVIPNLDRDNQNRARELISLLFNTDQAMRLIEEQMSFVYTRGEPSLVDADRMMWDYNPILTSGFVNSSKAGHGRFYESAISPGGFEGMARKMRAYISQRRSWISRNRFDLPVPSTPVISYDGEEGFPVTGLSFRSPAFSATGMAPQAIKWRIGEVYDPVNTPDDYEPGTPYVYEIEPRWETEAIAWDGQALSQAVPVSALVPGRTYRARVRHLATNGRWSNWSSAVQFVAGAADVETYQSGLVVSELMYHAKDASLEEIAAGFTNSDFDYLELYNVGPVTLDLSEVTFTDGIEFSFAGSAITSLAPGERVLVVSDLAAFESRYGTGLPVAGAYTGNLANDNDRLELSVGIGSPIRAFTYFDEPPWPVAADDGDNGFPLVLQSPETVPDHDVGTNWTAGQVPGGNPGGPDLAGFDLWLAGFGLTGSTGDDPDHDGLPLLLEYVLADGSPIVPHAARKPTVATEALDLGAGLADYVIFEVTVRSGLDDVVLRAESSSDLEGWSSPGALSLLVEIDNGDGTRTLRYRSSEPVAAAAELYVRLHVEQR